MSSVGRYLRNKVIDPLLGFLKQGASPSKLALTVSFGIILGIFPILGTTTALCIATAVIFKLNHGAIQVANYAVYPIQLILVIPFLQGGAFFTAHGSLAYDLEQLTEMFSTDLWNTVSELGSILLFAVLVWFFASIPIFLVSYYGCLRTFEKIVAKNKKDQA